MDAIAIVRTTLTGDTDTELAFSKAIHNISFALITASVTNSVYIKPRTALTGANAAAWVTDTAAYVLTANVKTADFYFEAGVTSIHIGSASAEEVQWHISAR